MEPAPRNTKTKAITGIVILVAIALLAIGAKALTSKTDVPQASGSTTAATSDANTTGASSGSTASTTNASTAAAYKDGTFTATGSYDSPGGIQTVAVSVTLQHDIITASDVQGRATDGDAREYQQDFIDGYKAFVTGKNVDSIQLSRVSGSSLTSNGFNSALQKIKNQAKS